jgi:hypothetical protein
MVATSGAKATSRELPLGMRTGSDEPIRVRATQNAIPARTPLGSPLMEIASIGGHNEETAASNAAVPTVMQSNIAKSRRFIETSSTAAGYILVGIIANGPDVLRKAGSWLRR